MRCFRLSFFIFIVGLGSSFADGLGPRVVNFDADWEFLRVDPTPIRENAYDKPTEDLAEAQRDLAGKAWSSVTLPHTAFVESKDISHPWAGVSWYRKTFALPAQDKGKRITLEFGGAMQIADVWVNNTYVTRHLGGYMGFTVDLTGLANFGGDNTVVVKLDSRPDPLVPPGKPLADLDFCYFSGLYRDVDLHVTNPLHITNSLEADQTAGGGVFVTYADVSPQSATVKIKTQVKLEATGMSVPGAELHQELFDLKGKLVAKAEAAPIDLQPGDAKEIEQNFQVINPSLWSPGHPNLYQLKSSITQASDVIDEATNRLGIRTFTITTGEGLKVNGQSVPMLGTNRHMAYPYIGNAVSTNAQYRDIWLIKNAGFNLVRLCHYPQDPSVYAACDELGVMAIDCTAGWQYYSGDSRFQDNTFRDVRQMIRRDRNHPSVLMWEISLNESNAPDDFCKKAQAVAKEEFPDAITCGDQGSPWPVPWDVFYPQWDKGKFLFPTPNVPYYARESGDWQFGGDSSTSRKTRGDGEQALLQQAWNFAAIHNSNLGTPQLCGDGTWVMFDYDRGSRQDTEHSGMADITRVPKWVYSFFQSQRDPDAASVGAGIEAGPMVFIANNWTPHPPDPRKVVVFSNCDEVELFVNGQSVARQSPDHGSDGEVLKSGIWNGGECQHLPHPAFTFDNVAFAAGELKAVGYRKGQACARQSVFTAGDPARLTLEAAVNNRPLAANGADVIFVHVHVTDREDHTCTEARNALTFTVTGPAQIIGPAALNAEAGIGSILIQATDQPGTITVRATSPGLDDGSLTIESVDRSKTQ